MNYYQRGQMDLSDRLAIETGICHKDSLKKIARLLGRHPSTIAHEIKENRTFIPGNYFLTVIRWLYGKRAALRKITNLFDMRFPKRKA